ncbi:MAG: hypothetical protein ABIP89_05405 [Polyangiaceae bacterium]
MLRVGVSILALGAILGCGAGFVACGNETFSGAEDGGDSGASGDSSSDGAGPADALADAAPADGDAGGGDASCDCVPFWCGCGMCPSASIVCTRQPRSCHLGCSSSCDSLPLTVCTCDQGRCVRGGTGPIGCFVDEECPPAFSCCVPDGGGTNALGTCATTCP